MGGSSSVVIGYRYSFGIHMGVGMGPVDELCEIRVGDRTAWGGSVTSSQQIFIDAAEIFGGEKGEGGIKGPLDVMMGEPAQLAPSGLTTMIGKPLPGYRGMFTAFFDGLISKLNPYPKKWAFRYRRALKGWDGPVFYAAKAMIPLVGPDPSSSSSLPPVPKEKNAVQTFIVDSSGEFTLTPPGPLISINSAQVDLGFDNGYADLEEGVDYTRTGNDIFLTLPVFAGYIGKVLAIGYRYLDLDTPEDTEFKSDRNIMSMNPAHILYELYTNRKWGRGLPPTALKLSSFVAVADQLYAEGFGLCLRWSRRDAVDAFAQTVLNHIGGVVYTDRTTALLTVALIRGDYDPDLVPLYDTSSGLLEVREAAVSSSGSGVTELAVTYRDPITNNDRTVRVDNLAAIQASKGAVNSIKKAYPGIPIPELALRVAQRDLRAMSPGLRRFTLVMDRSAWNIVPGSVIAFQDLPRAIPRTIVRVAQVQDGTLVNGRITLSVVQDVFALPSTSFGGSTPPSWVAPNNKPCVGRHRVFEVPYTTLARYRSTVDFSAIDEDSAFLGTLCEQGRALNLNYDVFVRDGSSTAEDMPADEAGYCPLP